MVTNQFKEALEYIGKKTFKKEVYEKIKPFTVELCYRPTKITSSFDSATANIKLYNLGRDADFIIFDGILEYAKQCSISFYGTFDVKTIEYVEICYKLLSTALAYGYINRDTLKFSANVKTIGYIYGTFENAFTGIEPAEDIEYRVETVVKYEEEDIKVALKEMKFRWNPDNKTWYYICIGYDEANHIAEELKKLKADIEVKVAKNSELSLNLYAHVILTGVEVFKKKTWLKEHGYAYNKDGFSGWSKKMLFRDIPKEREKLAQMNFNIKIKTH